MATDLKNYIDDVTQKAQAASLVLANVSEMDKNAALRKIAENILNDAELLKRENQKDVEAARKKNITSSMIDRLTLTDKRINEMVKSLNDVIALKDPVGEIIEGWKRPNGLEILKVRVPLGVIAIIYESRPNVTVDAASLCLKSGNATILRGGSESIYSNLALYHLIQQSLEQTGINPNAIQIISTTDRQAVGLLLKRNDRVDVVIPRGGYSLIKRVMNESTIPVIKHFEGVCHTYIDKDADLEKATKIIINAKCQRPAVCNAMETLLVHENLSGYLKEIAARFIDMGVELRGCPKTSKLLPDVKHADEADWSTEYNDMILSIKMVKNVDEAIEHINHYGSKHSDAIVTENYGNAMKFTREVDSATVYVNASTRFTDGGQFGLGAEIGISTDKLHARGPMGLNELTSYKYIIFGSGQIRE